MTQTLAFAMPGPFEMMVVAGVALMIFGKRLPSVGRNVALGIRGFQQGLKSGSEPAAEGTDSLGKSLPGNR